MKRLTVDLDNEKHTQFKVKAASQSLTMRDVLNAAIDDYLSGKYKPVKRSMAADLRALNDKRAAQKKAKAQA